MKYCLLLVGFFVNIFLGNCMEDGGDASRRANKPIWNETYADALKRDLLMSYDKFARPSQHYNATKVTLDLEIKHVEFDEASSVFTVYAWLVMRWIDEKLKWNQSVYGNLTKLSLAQHEIWQPDITLYNSITHNMDYFGMVHVYVGPVGNVTWVPPATFKTFCDSNLRHWPFDSHKCTLLFGSWVYDGNEIDVVPKKTDSHLEMFLSMFIENPEWEVTDINVGRSVNYFACCTEPYVDVRYNITIARRSSIYHTVILAPAFVVVLLTLFTFWLPAQYGEKILLNGVTVIVIVLFLLYFSQKLNVMSSHTPLIVVFYSHTLHMVCFSTLISVIVINLTRLKHQRALPWIIKKHLDGKLGDFLLLDQINVFENDQQPRVSELREHPFDEHLPNDEQQIIQQCRIGKSSFKNDYLRLATAVDRIAFFVYFSLFTIFGIAYSI